MAFEAIEPYVARGRRLSSWIEGFLEYTKGMQSPQLFRKWSAIGAVAGALERKVWIRSQQERIYPNLFIFLTGPPGAGKTRALAMAESLWKSMEHHHVAKVSLTKASLMDELAGASRVVYNTKEDLHFNSLLIASHELSALVPIYDADFLSALTFLYDGREYTEKRRGNKDPLIVENPCVNLIACTTPSFLVTTMPLGAWEQGFLSRCIIIYSEEDGIPAKLNLLDDADNSGEALEKALKDDIQTIGNQCGRLVFTAPAARLLETWNEQGQKLTAPSHPRLTRYTTRRPVHLLKLCMVSCVDRGADNIDVYDYQRAVEWMAEAELYMGDLFVAMQSGGDAAVIDEAWHYALTYPARNAGENVPLFRLVQFLQGRVPAMSLQRILEVMERAQLVVLKKTTDGVVVVARPKT